MPFRQAATIGADDERDVQKFWHRKSECVVEQQLSRRGRDQIIAANDFGHTLGGIVHDDGELIGGRARDPRPRRFPDDEIAAELVQIERDLPPNAVMEAWHFARQPEAPAIGPIAQRGSVGRAASRTGPWIHGSFLIGVRGAGGSLHVGARAGAGIDKLAVPQLRECRFVKGETLGLHNRRTVPGEAKPA